MTGVRGPSESPACCGPSRPHSADTEAGSVAVITGKGEVPSTAVLLEGGEFLMGTNDPDGFPADGEGPLRPITLSPFWIDAVAVTNARFAEFVDEAGRVTDAERYGW